MSQPENKNYFYSVLFTLILAVCAFVGFTTYLPERLFPEKKAEGKNIIIDSLAMAAIAESIHMADSLLSDTVIVKDTVNADNILPHGRTEPKDTTKIFLPPTANMEGQSNLSDFYRKLAELENGSRKKVRIGYFSDSMTDGDLIVQDVRLLFQNKYGGKGVGFVGITSLSATSRYSVTHKYSKNWITQSFLKGGKPSKPYGIDGQVNFLQGNAVASVEYHANGIEHCRQLYQPTLFFGKSSNEEAYINISSPKTEAVRKNLSPANYLNVISLTGQNPSRIKIEFHHADSIPFYGVNFDDGVGVHIDNFSMRGNSGLPLSVVHRSMFRAFDQVLGYDLIILHYGANVLSYGTTDYSWYEQKMGRVVAHLKESFPNADILIISIADKASKQDMQMVTDKGVVPLLLAQKRYAQNSGAAFLNLFNLMGGQNSMARWVDQEKPALANKDYTHFNANGSKKVASLIYNELERNYSTYKNVKGEITIGENNDTDERNDSTTTDTIP